MENEPAALWGRLYLDQDVPVQLAGMLRAYGCDVSTTLDAGNLGPPDDEQLRYAVACQRALVTHNRLDFERLHTETLTEGRTHWGILIAAPGSRNHS